MHFTSLSLQDDDLIGSIPLEPHLKVRLVTDPKSAPNCFEIYSDDGVIKAWKKDSDGKPVPGVCVCVCVCVCPQWSLKVT